MRSFFIPMFFIVFIVVFNTPVLAAEPAAAPGTSIEATEWTRDSARAELEKDRESFERQRRDAKRDCDQTRKTYLELYGPLLGTSEELKAISRTDLHQSVAAVNQAYRARLTALQAEYEQRIKGAKSQAEKAGAILRNAEARIGFLDGQLKQLGAPDAAEKRHMDFERCMEAKRQSGGYDYLASSDECRRSLPPVPATPQRVTTRSAVPALEKPDIVWLPKEFASCFPNEVKGAEAKAPQNNVP